MVSRNFISTFEQLAFEHKDVEIKGFIGSSESFQLAVQHYFSSSNPLRERLLRNTRGYWRLHMRGIQEAFNFPVVEYILQEVENEKTVFLSDKLLLEYYLNNIRDGHFSKTLVISEEFGEHMPYFILMSAANSETARLTLKNWLENLLTKK